MKKVIILSVLLGFTFASQAQTFEDAVQFSRIQNWGTARSAGMAGAFGALGGDLSTLSANPAGIGVFRKSEISITPSLNFANTKATDYSPKDNSFQLGDLGAVFAFYSPNFDWKGINFGINYTNLNNFNRKTDQVIWNSSTSLLDVLAASSGDYPSDELNSFSSYLAYQCYLINRNEDEEDPNFGYYHSIFHNGEIVAQTKRMKEDGNQGEYAFSFGTNYKDKLYLGLTIGIQSIWYKMHSGYTEALSENSPSGLDYYTYYEYKKMNGVGTNLKFGVIYRPIPEIRLGAAIHTPTWYNMNYSMATVLNQKAIVSVDYEYVNYQNANISEIEDDYNGSMEQTTNQDIEDYLRATHNFRVGAEYRFNSLFSLRAGYAFWDSPYHNETHKNYNRIQAFTAGAGLNFGMFYCDAAFIHKFSENETVFYSYYDIQAEPVKNKYLSNEARITLGIRF